MLPDFLKIQATRLSFIEDGSSESGERHIASRCEGVTWIRDFPYVELDSSPADLAAWLEA